MAVVDGGALTLPGEAASGRYTSPPLYARFPFNAAALLWEADTAEGSSVALSLRVSHDGITWSRWWPVEETADLARWSEEQAGDLIIAPGQYVQWAAELQSLTGPPPRLRRVTVVYIDSTAGPRAADAPAPSPESAAPGAIVPPGIIPRTGWGCPQPYGSPDWPPEYQRVEKIVVHHTATANNYWDGAEAVRAIWYYHAIIRGWGDVGYNYLVDRFGNVYQGRFGGDDVIAGHALCYNAGSAGVAVVGDFEQGDVSSAAYNVLVRLLAWLAHRRDLHPLGSSYFVDRVVGNISGHRDLNNNRNVYNGNSCYMNTLCPGDNLYARIYTAVPSLRQQVWNTYPDYGDGWLEHDTPTALGTGETVAVNLTVINRGRLTWKAAGANSVHVGYHWYHPDGTQYGQDPADDHRSALSHDVAYGQRAEVQALLTAPRVPGNFTLKWDLVQEGITWFAGQGVATLNVSAQVIPPTLSVSRNALHFWADPHRLPLPQSVQITNTGRGRLSWQATANQNWCWLPTKSGSAPASLVVSVDTAGFIPGTTYNAVITVTGEEAAGSPQQIQVSCVYDAGPIQRLFLPDAGNK